MRSPARVHPRVPGDLPEMAIEVPEIHGVDPPGPLVGVVGARRAGCLRAGEQCVDLVPARDQVADAEFTVAGAPRATVASFASSERGYRTRVRPPRSWNMAAAPAGVVSSPTNSVPITPVDSSPSPSR